MGWGRCGGRLGSTHRCPPSCGPSGPGSAAPAPGSAGSWPPGHCGCCSPPASAWPRRAEPGWSCPAAPGSAGPGLSGCSRTQSGSRGLPWSRRGATKPLACRETCGRSCSGARGTGASPAPPPRPRLRPHPPRLVRGPSWGERGLRRRGPASPQPLRAGGAAPARHAHSAWERGRGRPRTDTWRVGSPAGKMGERRGPPGAAQTLQVTSDTACRGRARLGLQCSASAQLWQRM